MHTKDVAKAINSPDLTVPLIPLQSWQKKKKQMQPADEGGGIGQLSLSGGAEWRAGPLD